jgi:hypothetical protein
VAEHVIEFSQLDEVLRREMRKCVHLVEEAALEAVSRGEDLAVAATDAEDLVHMGLYKWSWKHHRIPGGAELVNDAPYAGVIEYGRRPKRPGPPLAPILEWVERKLVARGEVEPEKALATAKRIRALIHQRGTRPRFVLRSTIPKMRRTFVSECRRRFRE